jgi:PTH1 family peptidyl-tRNA hydrolase
MRGVENRDRIIVDLDFLARQTNHAFNEIGRPILRIMENNDLPAFRRLDAIGEFINENIITILKRRHHARAAHEERLDKIGSHNKNRTHRNNRDLEYFKKRSKELSHRTNAYIISGINAKINTMKKIIVGLGNPGAEYENTYHNAGMLALQTMLGEQGKGSREKGLFEYTETRDGIILIKPLVFMNDSGKAVRAAIKKFCRHSSLSPMPRPPFPFLTILHDDSDIPIGEFKISFGRNSAGHKGVQSIIDALKTKEFTRVRIGIRPKNDFAGRENKNKETKRQKAGDFALKQITTSDRKILDKIFAEILKNKVLGDRS